MANTRVPTELALQDLYEGIKSRFEPVKVASAKGWHFEYPTSTIVCIDNPFLFSLSGNIPDTLGEFKLERIGIVEYRVTRDLQNIIDTLDKIR